MDPTATLRQIFEQYQNCEYEDAFYSCIELEKWVSGGGFLPDAYSRKIGQLEIMGFLSVMKAECKRASVA